ncbi:GspMb/PilO family protein [Serratia sp. AKBS12]|uniref:GspMb/PilO family protein n=1 Tax=Serratia sp. AKBS12 TaxID=2974597 RepID=UPI002166B368|nr:GspMb/PilO family protein [Serratia sp. AKBS12]MCS3408342.1 GspMb/PilO family protein [Serratia sp. AKBS12]
MRLNSRLLRQPHLLGNQVRWHTSRLYERLGLLPLLIGAVWLMLVIYWCVVLRPDLADMRLQQQEIQRQLSIPLPVIAPENADAEQKLNATEYQQVKALFAILEKHRLQAKESRYQLLADSKNSAADQLALEIPLLGEYTQLYAALQELGAAMPLQVDTLKISRIAPDNVQLTILLRVTLAEGQP